MYAGAQDHEDNRSASQASDREGRKVYGRPEHRHRVRQHGLLLIEGSLVSPEEWVEEVRVETLPVFEAKEDRVHRISRRMDG